MAKKSREDTTFDDGLATREQGRAYGDALLQMGAPKSKTPRRVAQIMVWGFVFLMPISLILGFMLADANRSLNAQLTKTLETQYNPSFRVRYETLGTEVVSAWYNKQKSPINLDSSIQWAEPAPASLSGTKMPATETTTTTATLKLSGLVFLRGSSVPVVGNSGRYEERLEYYALINGVPQIIGITIAIPDLNDINSVPVLISPPSIIGKPVVSAISDDKATKPVEEYGAANLSDTTVAQLNRWATAWTEDDASALKAYTQDSSTDNVYRGLGGGWRYVPNSVSVQWSALAPAGGGNAVARIKWKMQTPSVTIPAVTGENAKPAQTIAGAVQEQQMDVLVGSYSSGSPSVLAWGQAGTYSELKAYENAITKKEDVAPATVVPSGAPVPSEAATTAPDAGTDK
jgi:hypothetical protein